jgi:hypothetical protein
MPNPTVPAAGGAMPAAIADGAEFIRKAVKLLDDAAAGNADVAFRINAIAGQEALENVAEGLEALADVE